jgi:hypothetical protein
MVCTIIVVATPFNQKLTCCWTKTKANIRKDMAHFAAKQLLNGAWLILLIALEAGPSSY